MQSVCFLSQNLFCRTGVSHAPLGGRPGLSTEVRRVQAGGDGLGGGTGPRTRRHEHLTRRTQRLESLSPSGAPGEGGAGGERPSELSRTTEARDGVQRRPGCLQAWQNYTEMRKKCMMGGSPLPLGTLMANPQLCALCRMLRLPLGLSGPCPFLYLRRVLFLCRMRNRGAAPPVVNWKCPLCSGIASRSVGAWLPLCVEPAVVRVETAARAFAGAPVLPGTAPALGKITEPVG